MRAWMPPPLARIIAGPSTLPVRKPLPTSWLRLNGSSDLGVSIVVVPWVGWVFGNDVAMAVSLAWINASVGKRFAEFNRFVDSVCWTVNLFWCTGIGVHVLELEYEKDTSTIRSIIPTTHELSL
jgi:hypothetical protein